MTPYYQDDWLTVHQGDCREVMAGMEPESVHCVVTSPPYWGLRDYGTAGQLGLEPTPEAYVEAMVAVFREVRRVLRSDGTVWLNLGDSYAANRSYQVASTKGGAKHSPAQGALGSSEVPDGLKPKDLVGIPWRVAFALQADGWYLRSDTCGGNNGDRSDSGDYKGTGGDRARSDHRGDPVALGGRRHGRAASHRGDIDDRAARGVEGDAVPLRDAVPRPTQAGVVLDPFAGSGTTALVANRLSRRAVLVDLNADYLGQVMDRNRELPLGLVS